MVNKLHRYPTGLVLVLLFVSVSIFAQTENELVIRGGLQDFVQKAKSGEDIRIAYLGGSITEARGWRDYSFDFFKERFPHANFRQIKAAIGGTGSEFGAYRLKEHVLQHQPDLVFIEFAVNDNSESEEKIIQSMEGIVLQIKQNNPETAICLIYTVLESFLEQEKNGELPNSKLAMEKVAEHYGLASINFGYEVSKRVVENELIFKGREIFKDSIPVFSADGVHPNFEVGHRIYAEVFERSMHRLLSENVPAEVPASTQMHPFPLVFTNCISPDEKYFEGKWSSIGTVELEGFEKFSGFLDSIYMPLDEDAYLQIRFRGTSIGFVDIVGPESGALIIEIDGTTYPVKSRFDEYGNFNRISYLIIDDLEDGEHQIKIKLDPRIIDKESILSKRGIEMINPDRYKNQTWHFGKILVNGTLL